MGDGQGADTKTSLNRSFTVTEWDGEDWQDTTVVQQAIPWCTAHATSLITESARTCNTYKTYISAAAEPEPCVISTGPPDHFWWKDIT